MTTDPILPEERKRRMRSSGFWTDTTLLDVFDDTARRDPDRIAIVAYDAVGNHIEMTYGQLADRSRRIALNLRSLGVRRGEVVSFQLPNCWQFIALHLAALRIGAVTNPLMPIFRERELEFMLGLAQSPLLIVPLSFRGFDHAAMAGRLKTKVRALERIFVVGGEGEAAFERLLDAVPGDGAGGSAGAALVADDVALLLYTSGTTGEPKGVMHTSNSLLSNVRCFVERARLTDQDVFFMASPMAHLTGFLVGLMLPLYLGARTVLQEVWDPAKAAGIIEQNSVTATMASTPFLADLTREADGRRATMRTLRLFISAGAPIPRVLVRQASDVLGANIVSGWGMTENGLVTMTKLDDPPEKVFETDGCAVPGMEVRVVDAENSVLPPDCEGRLQARGPSTFVGYLKRPQLYAVDKDGWFETGDIARLDRDGYIRITGRSKDIIIRGGENVPVVEIEQLMYRHPAVLEVAIVGMPDERLGERACAFAVLKSGTALSLADVCELMGSHNVAKNYWPERIEIVDALPKTPSGKIQKFKLREMAKTLNQPLPPA